MMFWYGAHWSWWQGTLGLVVMLAFWILVAWAIYALVRSARWRGLPAVTRDARSILDERLARGHIDQDEYRAKLDLIRTSDAGPGPVGGPQ